MSENKHASGRDWSDPDDSPEWTDEMFDRAEFSDGGKVVRKATGDLRAEGTSTEKHDTKK